MKERPALFKLTHFHFREKVGGVAREAAKDTPEIPPFLFFLDRMSFSLG